MTEPKCELELNAIREKRRLELDACNRVLDMQWLDSRMEDGRMGRCLALIQREAEMEKDFQERTDHAAIVNERAAKETNLAIEIANVRREEICNLLRRHYLRERDPELREMIRKLQAGYTCRDLIQQIKHNEYRKLQEKAKEKYACDMLKNSLYNEFEKSKEEKERMKRAVQYRNDLQQQLVNRQQQKMCQYEDTLIEKKMLDDIVRTMADEDHRELQQKRELTERTRREMETFKEAQLAWKEKQKQMVIREETDIERQKQMMADRTSAILAAKAEKLRKKDEINQRICEKIIADEEKARERADLLRLLQEQEAIEKSKNDDIKEKEKTEKKKEDTKTALTAQMETKKRLEEEQKTREREFRLKSESSASAETQKELEKQRQQKEKQKAYAQQLKMQIQENERKK